MASHPNNPQSTVSQHDHSAAAVVDSLAGLRVGPTSAGWSEHAASSTARYGAEPGTPSRREVSLPHLVLLSVGLADWKPATCAVHSGQITYPYTLRRGNEVHTHR